MLAYWRSELAAKHEPTLEPRLRHTNSVTRRAPRTPWPGSHWTPGRCTPPALARYTPVHPLPQQVASADRKPVEWERYRCLVPTTYEQWARKGQRNPPPRPAEHCHRKPRGLPTIVWSDSRLARNRLAHTTNGNTANPAGDWATSRAERNRVAHAINGNTSNTGSASSSSPYVRPASGGDPVGEEARLRILENRARALRRRAFCHRRPGLAIPMPPLVWDPPAPPARPANPIGRPT